ncbi:MAG TPA: hypothetical protein VFD70_13505 [Anaerolineae bacterium]|nr:hypothetical protein [Anaerolineae bacterium]
MSRRIAIGLAWVMLVMGLGFLMLTRLVTSLPHPQPLDIETSGNSPLLVVAVLGFSLVGALIVTFHPHHRIGWLYCITGWLVGLCAFTTAYAQYAIAVPGSLPAPLVMDVISGFSFYLGFGLPLTFGLLLFPDGHLPSRPWQPLVWIIVGGLSLLFFGELLGEFAETRGLEDIFSSVGAALGLVGILGSVASTVLRWRHARAEEQEQLKWVGFAALLIAIVFVIGEVLPALNWFPADSPLPFILFTFGFLLLPIAAAIAILKYHLYDIDIIIRRTVTYAIVVAILATVYFGCVIVLQQVFAAVSGQRSEVITVLSTLAIAALFVPLRNQIQNAIDRRFNRNRYDAQQVLTTFAATVRDETDLEKLSSSLVNVVNETMQPKSVSLWLKRMDDKVTRRMGDMVR